MIKRALISVYDKTGLDNLAGYLHQKNVEIVSSGGTYKEIQNERISVKKVSEVTGSPEILGGRVKTLHPTIHAGILARKDQLGELELRHLPVFDLVVVNLYPFEKVAADGADLDKALENIDIGGPAMLRAAAKNFKRVTVICDPDDYDRLIEEMESNNGKTTLEFRRKMALKVFTRTNTYDKAITAYLSKQSTPEVEAGMFAENISISLSRQNKLRYGENPHQQAALYIDNSYPFASIGKAQILSGKELSFNNIWDLEAALQMILDFKRPFAAVIKHTNPCGAAIGETLAEAYGKALESDPMSAFGSIIGLNQTVNMETAKLLHKTRFIECILAPDYEPEALELLKKKKQRRLIAVGELDSSIEERPDMRIITGGALLQSRDTAELKADDLKIVTKIKPSQTQIDDLLFGFKIIKHVKSNAVLICKNGATVGIGAGQTSRVDSSIIAVRKAGDRAKDAVAASDAFFPMPDGFEVLAEAGVKAVIQPGGSKGDPDVIAAADKLNAAMVFSGMRHFKH
ncbi:MAG: bifunctional phosphoribosylaminoimidazolecarboxamide formyltransferase/IMP cyclohydrolase [candidate division Zixibacteria bacterium]|nr:bifunctional phosphoribosylaminoimidazolecarboxamide formyltransferase/IMP cyclohydrolase [candidate division Zixibacteria bacterium]